MSVGSDWGRVVSHTVSEELNVVLIMWFHTCSPCIYAIFGKSECTGSVSPLLSKYCWNQVISFVFIRLHTSQSNPCDLVLTPSMAHWWFGPFCHVHINHKAITQSETGAISNLNFITVCSLPASTHNIAIVVRWWVVSSRALCVCRQCNTPAVNEKRAAFSIN